MAMLSASNALIGRDVVPLFVYGSLRRFGTLHAHWLDGVVTDAEDAHALGYRLYRPRAGWFPYMVRVDETAASETGEATYGDLLWVRTGERLNDLIRMETDAGYDLSLVDVQTNYAFTIPALSFVWQRGRGSDWEPVTFNDWLTAT